MNRVLMAQVMHAHIHKNVLMSYAIHTNARIHAWFAHEWWHTLFIHMWMNNVLMSHVMHAHIHNNVLLAHAIHTHVWMSRVIRTQMMAHVIYSHMNE